MPRQRMDREALIRLRKIELDKLNALEGTSRTIVCQVSGGAGSAESFVRCVERFGDTRVVGLFADTGFEDPDLHRLLSQLEQHTQCDIVRLGGDRDIWDVFEKSGMMRIARAGNACKASVELKINASAKWLRSTFQPSECVLTTGLGWDEPERAVRFNRAWRPYSVVHPLFWEPRLSHCETVEQLEQYGDRQTSPIPTRLPPQQLWRGLHSGWVEAVGWSAKRLP